MADQDLADRVAFITGAGAGIGRAIALEWSARGGVAVITDRVKSDAQALAAEMTGAGRRAHAARLDVASLEDIRDGIAFALDAAGRIDALFNVAGTNLPKNVVEIEDEEWRTIIDINLTSIYRTAKLVIPAMRRQGGGSIVNIASIAGIIAENRCASYTASKGGVVLLTRNMAMDFARDNIRANAICPGPTLTPRIESYQRRAGRSSPPNSPMGRYAQPEEIARPRGLSCF